MIPKPADTLVLSAWALHPSITITVWAIHVLNFSNLATFQSSGLSTLGQVNWCVLAPEDSQYSVRPKCSSISVTDLFQTFASFCGLATPLLRSSLHHMRVRQWCVCLPWALRGAPGQGVRRIVVRAAKHFAHVKYNPLRSARDSFVPVHSSHIGWIATGSCPFLLWTSSPLLLTRAFLLERDNPDSRAAPRPVCRRLAMLASVSPS